MKTTMTESPGILFSVILFLVCDVVSGFWGEACGSGKCFYGYHCCSDSTGYCCPDGYICSGAICINLAVIIAPIVIAVIVIVIIVIVIIACKKKRAQGVVIAPAGGAVAYNVHQQTTQYGQQPTQYGQQPTQYGQPQPANYPSYGQPPQQGYPSTALPQDPPVYPGQPQTSSNPAYPPPPAEYKQ